LANAEKLGEVFVQVRADSDQLRRELDALKRKVDNDAAQMGNSFTKMMKKAALVGGITIALKKALDFSIEAKNLARDADEIGSKFNTVFETIKSKANSVADNFSKNFGLASSTTKDLLSATGDLLVGFQFTEEQALDLSEKVNSLAQDLTSFSNFAGGAKGASEALTKALLGETESAKSLGIVIRQDTKEFTAKVEAIAKTKNMTLQQSKAMAILEEAYKQSGKAIGDYARTKDSIANVERKELERMKEVKETIGNELIPIYRSLIFYISQVTTNMGDSSGSVSAFGTALKSVATPLIIIVTMMKQIANLAGTVGATLANLGLATVGKGSDAQVAKGLEIGWDIMLKDSEALNNALYSMWSSTSKKIEDLNITPKAGSGGNGGGGGGGKSFSLIKDELALYEDLYYGTKNWHEKSIELIKSQTKEMIAGGINKVDALKWEKQKIDELVKSYERMSSTIGELKVKTDSFKIPKKLESVDAGSNPGIKDDESESTNNIYKQYESNTDNGILGTGANFFDAILTSEAMARDAVSGFFEDMYLKGEWANSMLEKAFVGMANAFISQVQRMAAEWLAFQALKTAFNLFGIPIPGASSGGEFLGTSSGVMKLASGGSFKVPAGFPNDSYPMLVESGERVTVTSANRTGEQEKLLSSLISRMDVMNFNLMQGGTKSGNDLNVNVSGSLQGDDIYLSNKRTARKRGRIN